MTPTEIRMKYSIRTQATINLLQFFADNHLHSELRPLVKIVREAAFAYVMHLPDGQELHLGLRKLIDAKDCFIRQYLVAHNFQLGPIVEPVSEYSNL